MTLSQLPWYYFMLFIALGCLVLWIFDKFRIIKSKSLRFLVAIFVSTLAFWLIFDFFLAPE